MRPDRRDFDGMIGPGPLWILAGFRGYDTAEMNRWWRSISTSVRFSIGHPTDSGFTEMARRQIPICICSSTLMRNCEPVGISTDSIPRRITSVDLARAHLPGTGFAGHGPNV